MAAIVLSIPATSQAGPATSPGLQPYVESVFKEVLAILPEKMRYQIEGGKPVTVRYQQLNESLVNSDFCSAGDKVFGELNSRSRTVIVSTNLVLLAMTESLLTSQSFDCKHRSYEQTLKATIVHELAHLYDSQTDFSSEDKFVRLAGGEKRSDIFGRNTVRNYNYVNSPDPYEYHNLRESFAVNLEYYLLDDQYRCKKPAVTKLFDQEFGVEKQSCPDYDTILINSQVAGDNFTRSATLSTDNVYQVHYLFATEAGNIASRWGHAMFRLVMCSPDRKLKGPECLDDLSQDVVLSYRANVSDITINYLSGLLGEYPSQLYVYDMPEMIKEYTRNEFRNLVSVPLELSEDELDTFLKVTLERFWNYEGRYYFVTNHCGTESLNHLRVVDTEKTLRVRARTPRKMLKTLGKSPLVSKEEFEDAVNGSDPGYYYFPSREEQYQKAFNDLIPLGVFETDKLKKLLKNQNLETRQANYERVLESEAFRSLPFDQRRQLTGSMLLIERLLQGREAESISSEILDVLRQGDPGLIEELREEVRRMHGQPWDVIPDGTYGVPNERLVLHYAKSTDGDSGNKRLGQLLRGHEPLAPVLDKLEHLRSIERYLELELVKSLPEPALAGN